MSIGGMRLYDDFRGLRKIDGREAEASERPGSL